MYKFIGSKIASGLIIIAVLCLYSCKGYRNQWYFAEAGSLLWVNESHSDESIKNAVREVLENSSIIVAQVSWSPTDSVFYQNTAWYYTLAKNNDKAFMLNIDWLDNDRSGTRGGWSFENEQVRQKFKYDIKKLVSNYSPNYLTLGIEVNYYALTTPKGYKKFIGTFNELKASLSEQNPKLKIGLSFQLDLLYGVHSGWEPNNSLNALNAVVENLDYIGVSMYPDMQILNKTASLYSTNFLDSLSFIYKKPIGISETGISTIKFNDKQRADYITEIYQKFQDLNLKFIIWGSIIDDPRTKNWHDKIGLLYSDGTPKPEFKIWKTENLKITK
ncbi:MAG: hypothetical protein HXX13_11145 [Bacteroidetes bacterium]|nr:hypothetical protein [Bacteroidota bacterium]